MILKIGLALFLLGVLVTVVAFLADRHLSLAQSEEAGTSRMLAGVGLALAGLATMGLAALWGLAGPYLRSLVGL